MKQCALACLVITTACASGGKPRPPALYGSYRFNDELPGLGVVYGRFTVDASGRVTNFSGTCSPTALAPSGTARSLCTVQRVSIAGFDDSDVRMVGVKVLLSETTPSPSNPTGTQTRATPYFGTVSAVRAGR